MSMAAGTRLGPYEIIAPLGMGGMGEVYRARDPRMGREVAIKVSAERFSDRFEREVRAVAALNHANICQVYDVGPNYLVMELVEGPTLTDRIKQGALPLDEALPIARQIGDALEAAHEKGIIHRDLKPANIKIKPDGTVKVLDFGLAKMAEQTTAAASPEESPTVPMGATIAGQIMGTAAYMAPEQARGKPVDKRADIWAFGVVVYEMLTGRRLFEGETISDILAGVLTKEPQWERVSPRTRRLLHRCLEKDPRRRLRDIGDALPLLDDAPTIRTPGSKMPWAVAGVLAMALAISLWGSWRAVRTTEAPLAVRLDLDLGPDVALASSLGPSVILSPDGTRLVFVAQSQNGAQKHLATRRLNHPKATPLAGTDGAYAPFFSPDGEWVGFFAGGKLKKIRIDGSEPMTLCDASSGRGASWGEDGSIIAALDPNGVLSQVLPGGVKPNPVTELRPGEVTHRWPQVLPGGKTVLFTATADYGNFDDAAIAVVSLKDHRIKTLIERAGMYPRYLPSGHLVYVTKGTLCAVPFDVNRLEVRGQATVLDEVSGDQTIGFAQIDFSRTGTAAYRSGRIEELRTIQWLDGAGKAVSLGYEPAAYTTLRLSPAGDRLAVLLNQRTNMDAWIYDWQRGSRTPLTNGMHVNQTPVWSPDGRFVVLSATGGMFWARADGAGKPQPLTRSKSAQFPTSFNREGTRLIFSEASPGSGAEIRMVAVESTAGQLRVGEPQVLLKTPTMNAFAAISPDGRWLAYSDAEAGRYEVCVRAFPDNGTKVQVSTTGGIIPVWSRNGHELFYRTEEQRIMVVNYAVKGGSFAPEKPRVWSSRQLAVVGMGANFDLAPDGKRFVGVVPAENAAPRETQSHVTVMVNFFDEVRRRVAGAAK
jgi:Tol biopolymer transport system component/predicted Ser/Thr protein kinase